MQIIPAIDIIDGQCVRLKQGDFLRRTVYAKDPLVMAKEFESWGIKRLHLVDLDGAKAKKVINYRSLERIAGQTNLIIDFGGGVQTEMEVKQVFEAGAKMINCGSIAIKSPKLFEKWLEKFGHKHFILAADFKNDYILINGWLEKTQVKLFDFINYFVKKGLKKVLATDISKDGMMQGIAEQTYKNLLDKIPNLQLIASGGVKNKHDLKVLSQINMHGVILGEALYQKQITEKDLKSYISATKN